MISIHETVPSDLPALTHLINGARSALFHDDRPLTEADVVSMLTTSAPGTICIPFTIHKDGSPVGCASLHDIDWINRRARFNNFVATGGAGYKGGYLLLKHAFENMRLHKVYGHVIAENKATPRMAKRFGGRHEGILREHLWWHGMYTDVHIWALLRSDWEKRHGSHQAD